jgi:hypothetical protein
MSVYFQLWSGHEAIQERRRLIDRFARLQNLKEYTAVPLSSNILTVMTNLKFALKYLHISIEDTWIAKEIISAFRLSDTFQHLQELILEIPAQALNPDPELLLDPPYAVLPSHDDANLIIDTVTATLNLSLERLTLNVPYWLEWCNFFSA